MEELLLVACDVAREAGGLLRSLLGSQLHVRAKDARTDLVTDADTRAEALIAQRLRARFPDVAILAEEAGESGQAPGGRWIVDPLDGTTNYAHGYRCFCVSIAFERGDAVELGVVYDPMADELFAARRGDGARLNGTRLRVSACEDIRGAMLCTGFPVHAEATAAGNLPAFNDFMRLTPAIRRDGSAALDLCYVAAARFDGFWEPDLHPWDVAAGALIAAEAGARVTDYRGAPARLDGRRIVASNGLIHEAMLAVLAPYA